MSDSGFKRFPGGSARSFSLSAAQPAWHRDLVACDDKTEHLFSYNHSWDSRFDSILDDLFTFIPKI